MPWKHNGRTLREGREWVDDNGNQHSKVWMRYSDSQKATFSIVWEDPPASEAPFDNRFYWGRQSDGTLIPKSLTDVNEVDEDGNAVNDSDGNQIVTPGLKTVWVEKTKQQANSLLENTDWYVTRKSEKSTAIPSTISTYRDAVRTQCAAIETSINDASDLAAFMALYDVPVDSNGDATGNAPINDWPDEI
jgi:hypothetical protein|tara:strand:- start:2234 stop:2803 length:570 start_codon:yes stop_codon:yes gene_type:complete